MILMQTEFLNSTQKIGAMKQKLIKQTALKNFGLSKDIIKKVKEWAGHGGSHQ